MKRKKPFKCERCDYNFSEKKSLNTHIAWVHNRGPFKYDFCDKSFFSKKSSLDNHIASIHENKKPIKCFGS